MDEKHTDVQLFLLAVELPPLVDARNFTNVINARVFFPRKFSPDIVALDMFKSNASGSYQAERDFAETLVSF